MPARREDGRLGLLHDSVNNEASDVTLFFDASGNLLSFNHAAPGIFGYTHDEFYALGFSVIEPHFARDHWALLWKQLRAQHGFSKEAWTQRKDKSRFRVRVTAHIIQVNGEDVCCIILSEVPINSPTDNQLRSSEFKFRTLIEGSVQGIIVHNESFDVLFINEPGAEIMGFESAEEALGVNLLDEFILPEEREDSIAQFERVIRGVPGPNPIEVSFNSRKKQIVWALRTHSRIQWEGKPALLATFTDITDRKIAEEELKKVLLEVQELKDRLASENEYLQDEIRLEHNFEHIISQSKTFRKVLNQLEQVAVTDATVLILGETGTGKELLARAVHNLSPRRDRPLVKVNCAALPSNLIESELFGHEKGAFTGALARKTGRFELANGGTLFLDEIGDLPLDLQAKLLRVLQEGEFERLGNARPIQIDVRIIAATNRDLLKAIGEGTFREDLFYRLNVFPINPPPLRERTGDIPLLVHHFIDKYCGKFGKSIDGVPKRTMKALEDYDWPGNVRELENIIERAVIISPKNKLELGNWFPRPVTSPTSFSTLQEMERAHILKALQMTGGRVSGQYGAAKLLDIKPTTLESRMKKLGIKRNTQFS